MINYPLWRYINRLGGHDGEFYTNSKKNVNFCLAERPLYIVAGIKNKFGQFERRNYVQVKNFQKRRYSSNNSDIGWRRSLGKRVGQEASGRGHDVGNPGQKPVLRAN